MPRGHGNYTLRYMQRRLEVAEITLAQARQTNDRDLERRTERLIERLQTDIDQYVAKSTTTIISSVA